MATKPLKVLPISTEQFKKFREQKLLRLIDESATELEKKFSALCEEFGQKFNADQWILMKRKNQEPEVYYIHAIAGVMPDTCSGNFSASCKKAGEKYDLSSSALTFANFTGVLPSETEMNRCFNERLSYLRSGKNFWLSNTDSNNQGVFFKRNNQIYYKNFVRNTIYLNGNGGSYSGDYMLCIPIYRFNGINSDKLPASKAFLFWLEYDLEPLEEFFNNKAGREAFKALQKLYSEHGEFLLGTEAGISLDRQKVLTAALAGTKIDFVPKIKAVLDSKKIEGDDDFIKNLEKDFLECDTRRANLSPYGKNLLYGPNEGHWELWDYGDDFDTENEVILKESFTARDPASDISRGIVGIDFGTKSTVVVCENANHQQLPVQVGSGDYTKGINAANYENPTVMQFIDFEKFLTDYNARAGRPYTSWNDLTVSHTAFDNLKATDSKNYYSFFDGLKHWCGTPEEEIKIRDAKGKEWNLPAFLKLGDDMPNPIELYAYFLGLYINNMIRGEIILSYLMSFPVTYDFDVREKIRASFERGIKKSLPTALLNNEAAMKNFYVVHGASEPAAYAISALLGYNFDPEGANENYYGVFDFGGGTTDFDFGVLKESERQRYDYELKHFGANGDKTLGGENLLRLLAFEVFKANVNKLLRPDPNNSDAALIPFTYAAEREKFLNSESVINETSQEARKNMHDLMEALRVVWENPTSDAAKKICDTGITLNLYDESGNPVTNFTLDIGGNKSDVKPSAPVAPAPKPPVTPTPKPPAFVQTSNDYLISLEVLKDDKNLSAEERYLAKRIYSLGFGQKTLYFSQWKKTLDNIREDYKDALTWEPFINYVRKVGNFDAYIPKGKQPTQYLVVDVKNGKAVFREEEPTPPKIVKLPTVAPPAPSTEPAKKLVDLKKILRNRIEKGVRNFFYSLKQAFESDAANRNFIKAFDEVGEFAIFLAGNSSKSELVKEIFEDYIGENFKAGEILGVEKDSVTFKLFPPLGTPEAIEIQKARGVAISDDPFEAMKQPTGKTGVAFGLLRCRESGRIEVSDIQPDEVTGEAFQLYIGRQKKGKFKTLIDRTTKMNVWYEFLDDAGASFDILYTDVPEAATNNAPITISKQWPVRLEQTDAEAQIYIRPVASHAIEYAVAYSREDLEGNNFLVEPTRIDLK